MSPFARHLPDDVGLRERVEADLPFLAELYASTREEELRPIAWPDADKQAFLLDQFMRQHEHYLSHYPRAQWLVVEHEMQPIGRLYVEQTAAEIRLMDMALAAPWRGRGIGTSLLRAITESADESALPATLHVEPYNPAMRLYSRFGFEETETRGVYVFMTRTPAPRSPS